MPTKCQQNKKFAAMTICHGVLQYATHTLSCQSKRNELRDAREVFFQWLYDFSKKVCVSMARIRSRNLRGAEREGSSLRKAGGARWDFCRTESTIAGISIARAIRVLDSIQSLDRYSLI